MKLGISLPMVAMLTPYPLAAQNLRSRDDASIHAYIDASDNGLHVQGELGTYFYSEFKINPKSDYYYSVEPIGSAGHLIFIWEFTKIVSMGDYKTQYWLAHATSFHLIDIKNGYLGRADADSVFRFDGRVVLHASQNRVTIKINNINGLNAMSGKGEITFSLRHLDIISKNR